MLFKIVDFLQSKNGEELELEGLIADLTEGLTTTGKPFVNGVLFANGDTAPFKVWDTGLEGFKTAKGVCVGTPVMLHGATDVNPQNGEKQLVIRDSQEFPAISLLDEKETERLSQVTQVPISEMRRAIMQPSVANKFLPELQGEYEDGSLAGIAVRAMGEVEINANSPYSCSVHHYKGGFIEHIYNVVYKLIFPVGIPKDADIDWGVMYASTLLYHIGWVRRVMINPVTGLVIEKDEIGPVELGSDGMCDFAYAVTLIPEESLYDLRVRNLRHCVAVLNGVCAPATVEAQLINSFVKEELRVQETLEATRNLPKMARGFKNVNGRVKSFLNF